MDEFERELAFLQQINFKTSSIRAEYERKVHALKTLGESKLASGCPVEEVSRKLRSKRRELGKIYKEAAPPLFRQYIYWATENVYGDPVGPSYEQLRQRKSCEEIIESSSRPIPDLDQRLTLEGFKKWYETNNMSKDY